jgi:hypothetical protein
LPQASQLERTTVPSNEILVRAVLGGSMDPFSTFAGAAITQGVRFLYQQAGEFLSAWRARRRGKGAPPPMALNAPVGVTVSRSHPPADPPSEEIVKAQEELRGLVEPIQSGKVDVAAPAARAAIEQLRDMVETALQAPVRFAGEPRPLTIADVSVVTERAGRVVGLRADLAKLPGRSEIYGLHVKTGAAAAVGAVTGVNLN